MTDAIAASYDRWSGSYDTDQNATRDLDAHIVRTADLPVTGAAVLELGCGTGKNTSWLAEHARSVVAMDFSEGMLSRARTRVTAAHVDFLRHDITQPWPLPDAAFDVVVGNLVLEHVASLARCLSRPPVCSAPAVRSSAASCIRFANGVAVRRTSARPIRARWYRSRRSCTGRVTTSTTGLRQD
jgi:SAM-dependent methyltransferase